MRFLNHLFGNKKRIQPEDKFIITIINEFIRVEHPQRKTEEIQWDDILEIRMINTDAGPWLPDVWLALIGTNGGCLIPQGAKGYDEVFEIVSKYEEFDFEAYLKSMTCTNNQEFLVWKK